jgi:hypothetical protein
VHTLCMYLTHNPRYGCDGPWQRLEDELQEQQKERADTVAKAVSDALQYSAHTQRKGTFNAD